MRIFAEFVGFSTEEQKANTAGNHPAQGGLAFVFVSKSWEDTEARNQEKLVTYCVCGGKVTRVLVESPYSTPLFTWLILQKVNVETYSDVSKLVVIVVMVIEPLSEVPHVK